MIQVGLILIFYICHYLLYKVSMSCVCKKSMYQRGRDSKWMKHESKVIISDQRDRVRIFSDSLSSQSVTG